MKIQAVFCWMFLLCCYVSCRRAAFTWDPSRDYIKGAADVLSADSFIAPATSFFWVLGVLAPLVKFDA